MRRKLSAMVVIAAAMTMTACVNAGAEPSPGVATSAGPTMAETPESTPATSPSAQESSPTMSPPDTDPVQPSGDATSITTGLDAPWSVAFFGEVALISERDSGDIRELLSDGSTRVVTTIEGIAHSGEGGLLGVAVRDSDLYVYSTADDGNRVQRFEISGSAGAVSLGGGETIIEGIPHATTHNGGRIAFGPDGMLYISAGDAGDRPAAQDPSKLNGKILRLTPDGDVPADNPFPGEATYSLGHRNVQGFAWAPDGTMFASEFGQDTWDELNVIEPGANYGWPEHEGMAGADGFVDPVQQWATDQASPSGIAISGGTIFIANLRGRVLRAVPVADPASFVEYFDGEFGRLRDVTVAPDGSLWFVTNNTDGRGDPTDGDDRIVRVDLSASG